MHMLICAATKAEILPTIHFLDKNKVEDVEVLVTGVGLMTATYSLAKKICEKKPAVIIQAGIAGSIDPTLNQGITYLVSSETVGDTGVTENGIFHSVFDLGLLELNAFPWKEGRLNNDPHFLQQFDVPSVTAVTINEVTTDRGRIHYYKDDLKVQVESMEGAALHYIGLQENIPFLQLRSISNHAGERNKKNWVMEEAIMHLNLTLQFIISKLSA